jgi:dihydrofolate reductase
MQIPARMSMSADGYVTTPGGWPALTADLAFISGKSHGIQEFLDGCEAALMGRTTFEPALNNDSWPWPNLNVFVLCSQRPSATPDHVVTDSDPARLLEKLRAARRCSPSSRSRVDSSAHPRNEGPRSQISRPSERARR